MTSRTYWDEDLKSINSKYNLSFSNSYAEYVQTFQTVYSKLNAKLQEIEPAISLHRKEHYSGSIHDATHGSVLKTCKLNLYLYLNITNYVELEQNDGEVILKRNHQPSDTLDKWTNRNCLSQEKYFSWVESVLSRVLNAIRGYSGATIGLLKKDPPAFHFSVEKNGKTFIIKVIPALVVKNEDSCFALVHRNYYSGKSRGLNVSEYIWRASYPINEDDDLFNNEHMKITMRYIKLIRDSYELSYISSYMIKMMFITVNKQEGCSFWRQSLTTLLKHMVQYFYERIVDRNIPDAWHPGYNMLNEVEIDVNQLKDCENKLRSIIKRLEDPDDDVEEIIFHRPILREFQTTSSNNDIPILREFQTASSNNVPQIRRYIQTTSSNNDPPIRRYLQTTSSNNDPPIRRDLQTTSSDNDPPIRRYLQTTSSNNDPPIRRDLQTTSSNDGGNWMLYGGLIGVGAIIGGAMLLNSRRNNQ